MTARQVLGQFAGLIAEAAEIHDGLHSRRRTHRAKVRRVLLFILRPVGALANAVNEIDGDINAAQLFGGDVTHVTGNDTNPLVPRSRRQFGWSAGQTRHRVIVVQKRGNQSPTDVSRGTSYQYVWHAILAFCEVVETMGFEPTTSGLQSPRSTN